MRRNLDRLPPDRWDYVLIDCPPTLGVPTVNALVAVAELLVPVEAHVMALSGLAQLLQTVEVVKDRLNRDLRVSGILACRWIFAPATPGRWWSNYASAPGAWFIAPSSGKISGWPNVPPSARPSPSTTARAPALRTIGALADEIISQEGSE